MRMGTERLLARVVQVFGSARAHNPMGVYRLFSTGGPDEAGGMMTKMPEAPVPFWAYWFNVEALDAAMERVKVAGGKVMNGPMEVPGPMFIANCHDPQVAWFSMVASRR